VSMVSRRELHRAGRTVFVKPLFVLAARCLGPGPMRLKMVKLAHDLGDRHESVGPLSWSRQTKPIPTTKRRTSTRPKVSRPSPTELACRSKLFARARVLPLWEAFLIQMNDFDRYLESGLRRMLDPVVASGAPRRMPRNGSRLPVLAVVIAPIEMVAEALPAGDPLPFPSSRFD